MTKSGDKDSGHETKPAETPSPWVAKMIDRVTPSCREVTRLISESYDRNLTPVERVQLRLHYKICSLCIRYKDQLATLHNGLAHHDKEAAEHRPETLSPKAMERIRRCLDENR